MESLICITWNHSFAKSIDQESLHGFRRLIWAKLFAINKFSVYQRTRTTIMIPSSVLHKMNRFSMYPSVCEGFLGVIDHGDSISLILSEHGSISNLLTLLRTTLNIIP